MKTRGALATGLLCLMSIFCHSSQAAENNKVIRLATSTTLSDSGLMAKLKPAFEADTGYTLRVEAFGSGRALRSAREGYADVIIVHAPTAEQKFMQTGYGLSRLPLMQNEFIIAGPENDPAGLTHIPDVIGAVKAIEEKQARFISRGDDSGTHKKELEIWHKANIEPYGKWYIEYGQGMGKTLSHANETSAYILVEKGTWLARRSQLELVRLFSGDRLLDNPYHIIIINPDKHPSMNKEGAQRFTQWMRSGRGQDIIQNFTVDDEPLFTPFR